MACCYDFVTVATSVEHRDTGGAGNFSINDGKVLGFPMSAHVNKMPQAKLTRSSNQLACQAVHRWPDTPKTHNASRTHFLRAMLQVVAMLHGPRIGLLKHRVRQGDRDSEISSESEISSATR